MKKKNAFYDANLNRYSFGENGVKHAFVSHDFNKDKNAVKPNAAIGASSSPVHKPSESVQELFEELRVVNRRHFIPTSDGFENAIVG